MTIIILSSFSLGKTEKKCKNMVLILVFVAVGILGKNAYAISVLRRVEMKLDGRDIADNRYFFLGNLQ